MQTWNPALIKRRSSLHEPEPGPRRPGRRRPRRPWASVPRTAR